MTSITTSDINEAVAALRTGNCIGLNANNAGWGDAELFEIIKCLAAGFGRNIISLKLEGNNFSREAMIVLYVIIGPQNVARSLNNPSLNNNKPKNPQ